jgi:hypothetical protein
MRASALVVALLLVSAPAFAESYICKAEGEGSIVELTVRDQILHLVLNPVRTGQVGLQFSIVVANSVVLTAVKTYSGKIPEVDTVLVSVREVSESFESVIIWPENVLNSLNLL